MLLQCRFYYNDIYPNNPLLIALQHFLLMEPPAKKDLQKS